MFRTAFLILSGNAAASLVLLVRNLAVARMISVEDYGIAATFALVVSLLEMMSALGLQQQIVQSKRGDDPDFQAALQGFQLLRGVLSGLTLFLLAGPVAAFMNVPDVAWAYRVVALVPILNAFQHFDIHRLNREMVFGPMLLSQFAPAALSLLLVWPFVIWLGDYRVMLGCILVQAVMAAATSHLVARRPWQLRFDRGVIAGSIRFGWPLLVNNALLFAVFNGDRVLVGREIGMETLAIFSMGMTLTLTPTLVMAKSTQNFFLPQLSRLWAAEPSRKADFSRIARAVIEVPLLVGVLLAVGVYLLGGPVVYLLLGEKYLSLLPYLTWLAVMQALRVAKSGPSIVALAAGHTSNAMIANLLRIAVLPLAWYVAATTGDLLLIIQIAAAGEFLGYVVAMGLVRLRVGVSLRALSPSIASVSASSPCGRRSRQDRLRRTDPHRRTGLGLGSPHHTPGAGGDGHARPAPLRTEEVRHLDCAGLFLVWAAPETLLRKSAISGRIILFLSTLSGLATIVLIGSQTCIP